ncbi:MAG: hypothetical protein E6Q85_04355 [Thiothrix sp.]|nr:MAG: hypothetical protein E6Q85_04355 [Thiothrix sp.]
MKNMNKKILSALLLSLLATPNVFAGYSTNSLANTGTTDDADDKQTVTILVPEIALLDIGNTAVDLDETNLVAPTNAGDGFTGTATGSTTYAISSNVLNSDSATKRKITVAVDTTVGKVPAGAQLAVTVTAPTGATTGTATLTNTTTTADSATTVGNTRGTGLNIAYVLSTDPAGTGMIAHTDSQGTASDNIGLIYTLSDD